MGLETAIAVLVAFSAAFGAAYFGVQLSWRRERRVRQEQERSRFAHTIHGLLVETAICHGVLNNIRRFATPGRAFTIELPADSIRAALNDPLFHQLAEHSLVVAVQALRVETAMLNNVLQMHRQAAMEGRGGAPSSLSSSPGTSPRSPVR